MKAPAIQLKNDYYRKLNPANLERYISRRWRLMEPCLSSTGRLLDLGCGRGMLCKFFAGKKYRVTGLDYSWQNLKIASEYSPDGHYLTGNAEKIPFRDHCFDTVFVNALLHHVVSPRKILLESYRILAPGGIMIVIEPRRWHPLIMLQALSQRAEWGTFRLSSTRVRRDACKIFKQAALAAGGFSGLFYPFRKWPRRQIVRSFFGFSESLMQALHLNTHFYIIIRKPNS